MATPSDHEIRQVIGKHSIASIRAWLKRVGLSHTMNSRDEMFSKVEQHLKSGKITLDGLVAAAIGIEEASSKRTFLYRISNSPDAIAKIDEQLTALNVTLSTDRVRSAHPTMTPKLVYAINDQALFRAKWIEQHTRIKADKKRQEFTESKEPKVIVAVVNKTTGEVQLRYDKPDDKHSHTTE